MSDIKKRINPYKLFVGSFLPNWLLKRSEVTPGAKLLYARLSQYAGEDGECRPAQATLAAELGIAVRTVKAQLKELHRHELIDSQQRGFNKTNLYFFLSHEWMQSFRRVVQSDALPEVQGNALLEVPPDAHKDNPGRESNTSEGLTTPADEPSEEEKRQKEFFLAARDGWVKAFEEAHHYRYSFQGAKDALALKRMAKTGLTVDFVLDVARRAWQLGGDRTTFEKKNAMLISSFASQFGKIQVAVGLSEGPRQMRRQPQQTPRQSIEAFKS